MGPKRRPGRPASPLIWMERVVYLIVTVASVIFICFSVYRDSLKYDGILNLYDFAPGWGWLGREQDISNFEWHFWFLKFMAISPWYLGHIALGKIMETHSLTSKKYAFLVYGHLALLKLVGWQTVGLCVAHSTIMYIISQIGLSVLVWITSLVLLSTLNFEICITFMKGLLEDDEEETWYYLLMFTLALSNIRATSFCLEACWNRKVVGEEVAGQEKEETICPAEDLYHEISKHSEHQGCTTDQPNSQSSIGASVLRSSSVAAASLSQPIAYSYTDMVFYVMYLPLFFTGPILTYDLFKTQINQSQASEYKPRVAYLSLHLVRFLFWALFNEMILHFLYFNAIQNSLRVLEQVPLFTLAGLGFCHGQFFMLKYHVMFGYPGTVAKFDGLQPPDGPKCISYIYLYSDMWKYVAHSGPSY